jgi:hypothetical protein
MDGFKHSLFVSDVEEIGISDELEIPSTVIADGSPNVMTGNGVPQQLGSAAEEASSHPTKRVTGGHVPSDTDEIGILDTSGISSTVIVGGPLTIAQGTGVPQTPRNQRQILSEDIMPCAYQKYSNHPEAAAHLKKFRSIRAVNHGTQGLSLMEQEQSMIVEFQISLEGQAARWYVQQPGNDRSYGSAERILFAPRASVYQREPL